MPHITALLTCMTDKERPFIDAAIASTLQQKLPCKVIVLLNEASNLFNDLDAAYPTVRFIRTSIQPIGAMRNFGLQFVDTVWVAYLDGDDVWLPDKLERQYQFIVETGADLVGCDYVMINESGLRFSYALNHFIPAPSSWFVRTATMRNCPFEEMCDISEDGRWWSRYARRDVIVRTLRLSEILLEYRVRGWSLSEGTSSGKRKRIVKKIAASSGVVRISVMLLTWLVSRAFINRQYKATLLPPH